MKKVLYYAVGTLGIFVLGLVFNARYQALDYYTRLIPHSEMAVFLERNTPVAPEVIREKLINLDLVADARFVPRNEALEVATEENPALKEIIVAGENPFVPYFIVRPRTAALFSVQELTREIMKVEGIDEVRFDENVFILLENAERFARYYRIILFTIFVSGILLIAVKGVRQWLSGRGNYLAYLFLVIDGIVVGLVGAVLYYLVSYHIIPSAVLQLPLGYISSFVIGGVWLALLREI